MKKVRIYLVFALILGWAAVLAPRLRAIANPFILKPPPASLFIEAPKSTPAFFDRDKLFAEAVGMLKIRNDGQAMDNFRTILTYDPGDIGALWGESEVYRRRRHFTEAERSLKRALELNSGHAPSLINMSYLRYYDNRLNEAKNYIDKALAVPGIDNDNKALAYMMMGTINSRRSSGGLVSKIKYGTQIKNYLLKAQALAPELPEVRLGLGTFYLKAPAVIGGDLDKAIEELETAMKIAPDFATASARLAQAYKKKGDLDSYNLYLNKARQLDPGNEALTEE